MDNQITIIQQKDQKCLFLSFDLNENLTKFYKNSQLKWILVVIFLISFSFANYNFIFKQSNTQKNDYVFSLDYVNSQQNQVLTRQQKYYSRFLSIEQQQDDKINQEDNKVAQEEISKLWEYFYILRQYVLTLLLWIFIKFFDNGLIKKDGKYYLDLGFIMFSEGLAFGFFTCFGILSVLGIILSYILTYNLKKSVEFAHSINSLQSTLFLWIFTLIFVGYFSLTHPKKRGIKEKIVLTLAIIPSVALVFVLPVLGMIILMN
ncbi:hypothetical protein ABPG72_003877 [Tetrahymena utriculariae]